MIRSCALLFFVLGLASRVQADVPCPESCVSLGEPQNPVCSAASARDTSTQDVCPSVPGTYGSTGQYSLVVGTVYASGFACYTANGVAEVTARDRFRLVGPAGGGVITFDAHLFANGGAGEFGYVEAGIGEVGGSARSVNGGVIGGFNETLVLPLAHTVGDEFELNYRAYAYTGANAYARGTLSFALPPGYGVTSCGGYQGLGAVDARPASWGSIKIRYR